MTMPTVTVGGVNLDESLTTVFTDATDTLKESIAWFSETRSSTHASANWVTHYSVRLGVREASSGSWEIILMPTYGSYLDTQQGGKGKPYYTRLTIEATITNSSGDQTTVQLDLASTATIIGNGQGIPPTVINWNNSTNTISSTVEGHTLAFVNTLRIEEEPNDTGFAIDGEFVLRYDHAIDVEGRDVFYAIACYGGNFIASTGRYLRGDIPATGQSWGFTCEERIPYARGTDQAVANYPITHIAESWADVKLWTNAWQSIGYGQRLDSGTGPFMLNLVSRGADSFTDWGYAWLTKAVAARLLYQLPNPADPHTQQIYSYNYDEQAMRAKGRILSSLVETWRAVYLLTTKRTTDTEADLLLADLTTRIVGILNLLKTDYDNNSWLEYRDGGRTIAYWEAGQYFLGLLVLQETIDEFLGAIDPKIDEMMRTIGADIHANTMEWVNNGPHPRDANVTYSGGADGWRLEWLKELVTPGDSYPLNAGWASTYSAVHEWSKRNGLDTGAKQDAIITAFAGVNYKWLMGTTVQNLSLSAAAVMTMTTSSPAAQILHGLQADASMVMSATATLQIVGGELPKVRIGTAIAVSSTSIGTAIAVEAGT